MTDLGTAFLEEERKARENRQRLRAAAAETRAASGYARLTPDTVSDILKACELHKPSVVAKQFNVALPTVLYHLNKAQIAVTSPRKLTPAQVQMITGYPAIPARLAAEAFGVTEQHVYALRRSVDRALTDAPAMIGHKVTAESLKTILDLSLPAFEAAKRTGVSQATVHNYRRAARTSIPAAISDLV